MSDQPDEPPCNVRHVSHVDPHYFPRFESPHPHERFSEVMYAVSGETRAENHLITTAQDELLLCLLADERVIARLDEWSASVGLPQIGHDVAEFLDRIAERYSLSHRAALGRTPRPPHISIEDFLPEWYTLQNRLHATYRRGNEVLDAARRYVRDELQQPWPWLAYRLTFHVFQQAWEHAMGITMIHQRTSYLDDNVWGPEVQPFRLVIEKQPGETVVEAQRRIMAEAREACKNLQAVEDPKSLWNLRRGSPRTNQQENVKQDARWLYRQVLCGDVPYQMAMAWHHERQASGQHTQDFSDGCGCQQRVYRGLRQVTELLNATPFVFSDTDK